MISVLPTISSPRDGRTAEATTSAIAIATSTCSGPVYMTIQRVCTLSETGENWRHDVTVACLGRRGVYRVRTDEGCCSAVARSFCRQTWSAATAPPPMIINPFAITPLRPRRHNEVIVETSGSRRHSIAAATNDDNNDNIVGSENKVCEHILPIFYKYIILYVFVTHTRCVNRFPVFRHVLLTTFYILYILYTPYLRSIYFTRMHFIRRQQTCGYLTRPQTLYNVVYGHNASLFDRYVLQTAVVYFRWKKKSSYRLSKSKTPSNLI